MKKNYLYVPVLLGALTLGTITSCVDDNESQSVTDIRSAKAEQLKALASLSKAQAEAALIEANATKALKEAEAKYKEALTEDQKQDTEQARAEFAVKLQQIQAEAEAAINRAKYEAAKSAQLLLDIADQRLRALYSQYANAVFDVNDLQYQKITKTNSLAQAEAGLITTKALAEIAISGYQNDIDMQEYTKKLYEEYEGADLVSLKQEAAKLNKDLDVANDEKVKKQDESYTKESEYYNARNKFIRSSAATIKTVKAANELSSSYGYSLVNNENKQLTDNLTLPYYTLNASSVERVRQNLELSVNNYSGNLGKETDEASANEYTGSLFAQKKYLEKQKNDALQANPNADVTSYENKIKQKSADIETEKKNLENATEKFDKFKSLVASFSGDDLIAYNKAIEDLKTLAQGYDNAIDAYNDALAAYNTILSKINTVTTLMSQTDVEQNITACNKEIERLKVLQQNYKNNISNSEAIIAQYKQELTSIDAQIIAKQAIVDNLSKQIKAATAE